MKIGIIGTGNVGSALGKSWTKKGHDVMLGSRDPEKSSNLARKIGSKARGGTYSEAVKYGDIIILAVHYDNLDETLEAMGDLEGKIIVDCVNPLAPRMAGLQVGLTTSAAEEIAKKAKGARVVKAFNSIGAQHYGNPQFGSQNASGFICGDNKEAKKIVSQLATDLGFDVVDCGPLSNARLLEPLAMLWINLAYVQGMGPNIAFKLLKK